MYTSPHTALYASIKPNKRREIVQKLAKQAFGQFLCVKKRRGGALRRLFFFKPILLIDKQVAQYIL